MAAIGSTTSSTDLNKALSEASTSTDLQANFLKMLVAQLNNQDPTNPLDNAELTSQLAQLSTVSGIEKLNTTLSSLVNATGTSQTLQAAALIDKTVLVAGNGMSYSGTGVSGFGASFASTVDAATATITNASGKVVRTIDLGAHTAGVHTISWDGLDSDGVRAASGNYRIAVSGTAAGVAVTTTPLSFQTVAAVQQGTSGVQLTLVTVRQPMLLT